MKVAAETIVPLFSRAFPHTFFPGALCLDNGELLLMMVEGSGFESSDQRIQQARSTDQGRSWQLEEESLAGVKFPGVMPFSPCAKPTQLSDGRVVAAGYGFHRDRPEMGLSDYAEKFGRFPACGNFTLTSCDRGRTWEEPVLMEHPYDGLELSGPLLALPNGTLLAFAAPFALNTAIQRGIAWESSDGGSSWHEKSTFWESPAVAPWEIRSIRLSSGRIVLVLWAFDLKNNRHLPNHLVFSDDNGKTWSAPIDTGLRGQASNLMLHKGKLCVVQARREGSAPGIYLSEIKLGDGGVSVRDESLLWDAQGMSNSAGKIEKQFANLKFGQPSVLSLGGDTYLLLFWSFEDGRYAVKTMRFQLQTEPFAI